MNKKIILFTLLLVSVFSSYAQPTFSTSEYMDINNIKAGTLVHGDMWWNVTQQVSTCEFPKGSGKALCFATALWMSGYDAGNQLHIAAQTYRQNGNDYWPGPLDNSDTLTYNTSKDWAKIWKVNRTTVDSFRTLISHSVANTPTPILQWPAKGNIYAVGDSGVTLAVTNDMAPFIDVDHDGIYNALQGDYPDIKGDQALWWVFSDNGPKHNETNGKPLKVEVHAMAYAYKRGTMTDNAIYYEYTIINKSSITYNNFRIGQWICAGLGYAFDDYIGFDSTHRMAIAYNGATIDGTGQTDAYGNMIPQMGVSVVSQPGDNGNVFQPAGSFMYISNTSGVTGNPSTPEQYNNYLRSRYRDSTHLKDDFTGPYQPTKGYGASYPDCNYVFPGDPSDTSGWSECSSSNLPGNRTLVMASNDFTLPAGGSKTFVTALLATAPALNNSCPNASFTTIKNLADTVWNVFQDPYPMLDIADIPATNTLHVYPNPARDKIFIASIPPDTKPAVYNVLGQHMTVPVYTEQNIVTIDIAALPCGVYNILYSKNGTHGTSRFVKD